MERVRNVDKLRACACLLGLVYHCWALSGTPKISIPIVREFIIYGGEIGVTSFFVLSGYGIYSSLFFTEACGKQITFLEFLKKEFIELYRIII